MSHSSQTVVRSDGSGDSRTSSQIERENQIATDYFQSNYRFRQGRFIGGGSFGSAFIFHEVDENENFVRKVIAKLSQVDSGDWSIDTEVKFLEETRGAEHIVRLILDAGRLGDVMPRRAYVMEYVAHGTWVEILDRLRLKRLRVPNRMLWSLFLCLARAVAGMAFPPRLSLDDGLRRETWIEGKEPSKLAHNDMNLGNVMVDAWDPTDPEHKLCPVSKLIDFGLSQILEPVLDEDPILVGIHRNINSIAEVMVMVASGQPEYMMETVKVPYAPGEPPRNITTVNNTGMSDQTLSDELRNLIYHCGIRNDDANIPSLAEVIRTCENAVLNQTAADYAHLGGARAQRETDRAIDEVVQMYILNADVGPREDDA